MSKGSGLDAFPNGTERVVESADGTRIAYFSTGAGPDVVAIPGALSTASDYQTFATALSATHKVHVIERRGRGLSGPQGADYSLDKECEDVAVVMAATGSSLVFGHSYGGLIALEVARRHRAITAVAVYEPGVSIDGSLASDWIAGCERSLAKGKRLEAFAAFSIAAGPPQARRMPLWLMKAMLPLVLGRRRLSKLLSLFPTTLPEHRMISGLDGTHRRFESVQAPVLLMAGEKTEQFELKEAVPILSALLPNAEHRILPKLDHFGPDRSGPEAVATETAAWFRSAADNSTDRPGS